MAPTKTVATRLDPSLIERIERVAHIDRRSVAQVMALLIERGLPEWESEIEARQRGFTANSAATAPQEIASQILKQAVRRAKSARE